MSEIKHICRNCKFMRRNSRPKVTYKCRIKIMHGILARVKPSNECDVVNGFQPLQILDKDK
jgi:hypothetical protein